MFNLAIGSAVEDAGRTLLRTTRGLPGHAIYGPYEYREAGRYAVEFRLRLRAPVSSFWDAVAVVVDVVRDTGADVLAVRRLRLSEVGTEWMAFRLEFALEARAKLEYRVWTSGAAELELEEHQRVVQLDLPATPVAVPMIEAFPDADDTHPAIFTANLAQFRQLFDRGVGLGLTADGVVVNHGGILFNVQEQDDFVFVGEVFVANAYNFVTDQPTCVVDIGMNIGLSTLQFARKDRVVEVHSFEPFPGTYARALRNLALNPELAGKVRPACLGLSDRDWHGSVAINAANDSGSNSVIFPADGPATTVDLADAGARLAPILADARARGLRVVVKVDCEGSEFAIFRSLAAAGLFPSIDAVMVEWHALFDQENQQDLIRPLLAAGFIVFDQSPPAGNGFFYGIRAAPAA